MTDGRWNLGRWRLRLLLLVVLVALAGRTASPVEAGPAPASIALSGCRERFVIAPGEEQLVRRGVPPEFELARDASGRPLLYITAIRCERYVVSSTSSPTNAVAFAAMVRSPDGVGCMSGWPVVGEVKGDALACSMYVLFAAYDNPAVVAWLREGTPDLPVHHVPRLSVVEKDLTAVGPGSHLQVRAPRPTPSPFEMEAVVHERPVQTPFVATFWVKVSAGLVPMRFESPALALGDADGSVRPTPGSEMARMLGGSTVGGAAPFRLIAGNRWERGSLTKVVMPHP